MLRQPAAEYDIKLWDASTQSGGRPRIRHAISLLSGLTPRKYGEKLYSRLSWQRSSVSGGLLVNNLGWVA